MPKLKLTKTFIDTLAIPDKTIDYFDTEVKGLLLRVYHSGGKTYQIYYRNTTGEQKRYTLAKHGQLTLTQARELAAKRLAEIHSGIDVQANKIATRQSCNESLSLEQYLQEFYLDWYKQNRKDYYNTELILLRCCKALLPHKLNQIDKTVLHQFLHNYRKEKQVTQSRLNRIAACLKGAISRAVEFGYLTENKLTNFRLFKIESHKMRYLDDDETQRLFDALEETNQLTHNMVLTAYYTGMRRGEIFTLRWRDINFDTNLFTLDKKNTKSGKGRHIPIHAKLLAIFGNMQTQKPDDLVFKSPITGEVLTNLKHSWETLLKKANIQNFRFYDLRHTFASKLVMKGVDLNTVRELMGHSDIKMTLVYAHLAPEHKQKAVDLLC